MSAAIIIPARWDSSRFPGKPLADIAGHPLIFWTWRAAIQTHLPVYIATDDFRIAAAVRSFGGNVIMTGQCRNGTERCFRAHEKLGQRFDTIINWQGDAPLIRAEWIIQLMYRLAMSDPSVLLTTLAVRQPWHPGAVEAITSAAGIALEFKRHESDPGRPIWLHQGIYTMHSHAAAYYMNGAPSVREIDQGLEQLRWPNFAISIVTVDAPAGSIRECNHPEDAVALAALIGADHASD